jgi:hypothetical protein
MAPPSVAFLVLTTTQTQIVGTIFPVVILQNIAEAPLNKILVIALRPVRVLFQLSGLANQDLDVTSLNMVIKMPGSAMQLALI